MVLLCWTCKKICLFLAVLGLCWFGGRERELFSGCRERELLSSGMRISHSSGLSLRSTYARYLDGQDGLQAFLDAFGTDAPFIPLCYRGGVAAYDRRLTAITPTGYDPYHGIAGWK